MRISQILDLIAIAFLDFFSAVFLSFFPAPLISLPSACDRLAGYRKKFCVNYGQSLKWNLDQF